MSRTTTETVVQLGQDAAPSTEQSRPNGFADKEEGYKYDHLLPRSDPTLKLPPLEPFEHTDPGSRVSGDLLTNPLTELLSSATRNVELTPSIGTEIEGVQLSSLDERQRDQLAVLVARRKVVVLRNQDFLDLPIERQLEFGRYFGRLHVHPTSSHPQGQFRVSES
jgi:sulfonate dioxygenase